MNGPVPIATLTPLARGDTGEYGSYGDMYDGYFKDGPPAAKHFKDAAIPPRPVDTIPGVALVEPIEVLRARVETNQRRGQPAVIQDDGMHPEIAKIRRIIKANQQHHKKDAEPNPPGWS